MPKLKDIEAKYGVDFGCKDEKTLRDYLISIGLPSMAKVLGILEEEKGCEERLYDNHTNNKQ